jgi:c-di-GMP-related signal transduction protein
MSSSVIVDGLIGLGLKNLTEGRTAFINFSEEMILEGAAELLEPEQVVIELLERVKAALVRGHMCEEVGELVRSPMNRNVPAGGSSKRTSTRSGN